MLCLCILRQEHLNKKLLCNKTKETAMLREFGLQNLLHGGCNNLWF